eukprot:GHVL01030946.1.p1 GENE.GHVL01030946.1~~GHVL01030946.1.p1  ORF type:complete len:592 (+),score=111.10 GHVL01030946.1:47-1822(+)
MNIYILLFTGVLSCITNWDKNDDFFLNKIKSRSGTPDSLNLENLKFHYQNEKIEKLWTISYHKYFKVIDISSGERYVLWQCGTIQPPLSELPSLLSTVTSVSFFEIPVKTVGTDSSIFVSMIEALGERDSITGINNMDYMVSPCLMRKTKENPNSLIIADGFNKNQSCVAYDAACKQAVFGEFDVFFSEFDAQVPKLVIPQVSKEQSPWGMTGYMDFIAAFYNKEDESQRLINQSILRYGCHGSRHMNLDPKPVVMWSDGFNQWTGVADTMQGGHWAEMFIYAAGGIPMTRMKFSSNAEFIASEIVQSADIWIYPLGLEFPINIFSQLKVVQNRKVFDMYLYRGSEFLPNSFSSDWFGSRYIQPDAVITDLNAIFYNNQNFNKRWFRNIFFEISKPIYSSLCTDLQQPLKPVITNCVASDIPPTNDGSNVALSFNLTASEQMTSPATLDAIKMGFAAGVAEDITDIVLESTTCHNNNNVTVGISVNLNKEKTKNFNSVRTLGWLTYHPIIDTIKAQSFATNFMKGVDVTDTGILTNLSKIAESIPTTENFRESATLAEETSVMPAVCLVSTSATAPHYSINLFYLLFIWLL